MQQFEEARRYVLDSVFAGDLQASQAAEILGISERHAWRLLAAYRSRGVSALRHGNRGRRPHNAVPAEVASAVVRLATTRYPGVAIALDLDQVIALRVGHLQGDSGPCERYS